MPGVTKRIYNREIQDILHMWNLQLKLVYAILPKNYSFPDIANALKEYFPHEWDSVEIKHIYYTRKDECLQKRFHKARYNMPPAEKLLTRASQYKIIMDPAFRKKHDDDYSEDRIIEEKNNLFKLRNHKIQRINNKINKAKEKVQQVTPKYIDQLIGLYERKRTSQKDKVYILAELKKYYSPPIIQFFFKLNDTELNKQLREEAFFHLQSFNYQPRLRRQKYMRIHTKSKKRKEYLKEIYPFEKFIIKQTPQELEYRIANSREQKIKKYDFFISHSYKDREEVQKLISYENNTGKDIFCDWINDYDYLKRHLVCDSTLRVIEMRLKQSDALLFVLSDNSKNSVWCKYELNYFYNLGKPIYIIDFNDLENNNFCIRRGYATWFLDDNYKELVIAEAKKIV